MNTTEILQGLKKPECTCNHIHCTYRAHNAAIDAAIAALGDGVVVPLEPTEEMLAAGFNRSSINSQLLQGIYKAMLAAAPQNKDR